MTSEIIKQKVSKGFAEYLKNVSTDFHHAYAIFRQSSNESSKINILKTGHLLLPW